MGLNTFLESANGKSANSWANSAIANPQSRLFTLHALYAIFVSRKVCSLRNCGSFKSANHKKDSVRKSQICLVLQLRKLRKSNKLFVCGFRKCADLRCAELICGPSIFDYEKNRTGILMCVESLESTTKKISDTLTKINFYSFWLALRDPCLH